MRVAVFVRYHSGDGAGHVGWGYDLDASRAHAGSVENHSGHWFTPATDMGFWDAVSPDPMPQIRSRGYDDIKWLDVARPDPAGAYRTVLWIKHQAYFAIHRNCEDDAYDILRSYGVKNLPPPLLHWFPTGWFHAFSAAQSSVPEFNWKQSKASEPGRRIDLLTLKPRRPAWRRPWHPYFHLLRLQKLQHTLFHLLHLRQRRAR